MKQTMKKRWLVIVALAMIAVVGGALFCVAKPVQAAHTHSYRWVTKKNASCTSIGYKNYECSCGACMKSETIPKTPHNYNLNAATCTTAKKCRTCGYVAQGATGHSWNRSSATCTASKSCTKCGTVSQAALGHAYCQVTTKQPTCGAAGTYETKCSRCGIGSPTGNGAIAPTGQHSWNRSSASCTEAKKCVNCGTIGQPALGHAYSQVTTKQPTCGAEGTYETKCSRCGIGSSTGNGAIAPTGQHTWTYTSTTQPTCTANGYDLYTCSTCKQTKKETIGKLGHAYSQVTTKQPTCGAEGTYETKCSRCGIGSPTGNGTIAPTGKHTWELTSTTSSTCTANGYNLYTCSVCKQTKKETIPMSEHTMKVEKKAATVKAEGYEKKYCTTCGYVEYNKVIPKLNITATFDTAGGQFQNGETSIKKTLNYGKTYGKVDSPVRSGYTFIGWYTGKNGGSAVNETTIVKATSNHMVYAHWLKNTGVKVNASNNPFSFVVDDFGGEDCSYYFVENDRSTVKTSQPSWVESVKCTTSTRTIKIKSKNTTEKPDVAYIYMYSKTSGKAVTYKIIPITFCEVAVDVDGKIQYYYVPKGQTFIFPAEPELRDGKVFNGWGLDTKDITNKSGDAIIINSNRTVFASVFEIYRKIGSVYNADDDKTYSIWMIKDGFLKDCTQNHNGNDLMILDTYDPGENGKIYQIRDSWRFNEPSFQQGVCELIIQYNKDMNRTEDWNRMLSACMLEWEEHNALYELTASLPFSWAQELAEVGRHADLDAKGAGCWPSDVEMNKLIKKIEEIENSK